MKFPDAKPALMARKDRRNSTNSEPFSAAIRHSAFFLSMSRHRSQVLEQFLFRIALREMLLFEPIGDGHGPTRLQALRGRSKKPFFLLTVRDGFDGPNNIKGLVKFHFLSVH